MKLMKLLKKINFKIITLFFLFIDIIILYILGIGDWVNL